MQMKMHTQDYIGCKPDLFSSPATLAESSSNDNSSFTAQTSILAQIGNEGDPIRYSKLNCKQQFN